MQNLQITATTPIVPAKPSAPAQSDNTSQATEPFGNVLARQQASAADAGKPAQGKQGGATGETQAAAINKDGGNGSQLPEQASDAANMVPGDILAALLPAVATTDKSMADGKTGKTAKADTIDLKAAPAGDATASVLAAMLPADAARTAVAKVFAKGAATAVAEKGISGDVRAGDGKVRLQQPDAVATGKVKQHAADKLAAQPPEISGDAKAVPRAQGKSKAESAAPVTNADKEKAFTAALEGSIKNGAKAVQAEASLAKTHAQPDSSLVSGGVLQNGVAAPASGQNGVTQTAQAVINTPVTDGNWGNEFNQRITWMATQQQQTAELHLNPPNLGPLDVVLNVNGDQATALFTSPHAAVRDAVEQALPKLRDMMADNGITLGNAMVSDQSAGNNQAWQAEQQSQRGSARMSGSIDPGVAGGTVSSGDMAPVRRHNGMVDMFV